MRFEPNVGQTDEAVRYVARGHDGTVFLTATDAVLVVRSADGHEKPAPQTTIRLRPLGASRAASASALDELPGRTSYFRGDPTTWVTGVKSYARVRYGDVYPGIDLVYYGGDGHLEYDFVLGPGADPRRIAIGIEGADAIEIAANGDLVLHTATGEVRQRAPHVYQERSGKRVPLRGHYVKRGTNVVGFVVARYDRRLPLVIDPQIVYATYLGGAGTDVVNAIAADGDGAAYVAGFTSSADFPAANGGTGGSGDDAFVTKLSADGASIVYTAFFGGDGHSEATGLRLDSTHAAYVVGATTSTDFPRMNAFQTTRKGNSDGFVLKLAPDGTTLVYASYLGGSDDDFDLHLTLDAELNAFVTGSTRSTDFPTVNPVQAMNGGDQDGFLAVVAPDGGELRFATYVGGNGIDSLTSTAIDPATGDLFVYGDTDSTDIGSKKDTSRLFITHLQRQTPLPAQSIAGARSVLGAIIYGLLVEPEFTCLLLGVSPEDLSDCVDSADLILLFLLLSPSDRALSTTTASPTGNQLYMTSGDFCIPQASHCREGVTFRSLDPATLKVERTVTFAGSGQDHPFAAAANSDGAVFIAGDTNSPDFPTVNPVQNALGGGDDAFIAAIGPGGTHLGFSTYFGGTGDDQANAIALDPQGNVYVAGSTMSPGLATTGVVQTGRHGPSDAFVLKLTAPTLPSAPADPKPLLKCGKTLGKAATTLAAAQLKDVAPCTGGILKCIQTIAAGTKRDACVAKAAAACTKDIGKTMDAGDKLDADIAKACSAVPDATMLAVTGLGYTNVAAQCTSQFGTPLTTLDTISQCVRREYACRSDEILGTEEPRAKELLGFASVPPSDVATLSCLPDHAGVGADLGDPKGAGKGVVTCSGASAKAGAAFLAKKLKSLQACVGAVFACAVTQPGDAPCIAKAQTTCDKSFTAIDTAAAKLQASIDKACGGLDFSSDLGAAAGANLGVLASDCATLGVASMASAADYEECVFRRVECHADELLEFAAPRAAELLPMVGRQAKSAFCP
jgi:hypothetical protein